MSNMHTSTWVNDFLQKRGLDSFTGNPVYSYRISESEFDKLKTDLRLDLYSFGDYINSISFPSAFVLYACEWWRKEYSGSNWSWDPILQSLKMENMNIATRSKLTENGFKRLKRKLIISQAGEKAYLGTIAFESGIPRSLLNTEHYFSKVITDTFSEFQTISSYEITDNDIIQAICVKNRIPITYQSEGFYDLLKNVVDELIYLNIKFDLRTIKRPVDFLESEFPEWKSNFPIVPDSELAINFINNLLSDTSEKRDLVAFNKVQIKNRLTNSEQGYFVEKVLNFPTGIVDCSLFGLTLTEWENLSNISTIVLVKNSISKKIGTLYKVSQVGKLNSIGLKNIVLTNSLYESIDLRIENPLTFESFSLMVDSPDFVESQSPLIYSNSNDEWKLKSVGTSSLKTNTYRVLVKNTFEPLLSTSIRLPFKEAGIKLFEIHESDTFSDGDLKFSLKFSDKEEEIRYHLVPSSIHSLPFYPIDNKNIYLGAPKIYQVNSKSVSIERIRENIEYLNSNGQWVVLNEEVYGRLKVRKRDETGITLFQFSINILPKNLSVAFLQNRSNDGISKVVLNGIDSLTKAVESTLKSNIENNTIHFHQINESLEEFFKLRIFSKQSINPVILKIPLPKDITSFNDENGDRIPSNKNVSLRSLIGKRFVTNNLDNKRKREAISIFLNDDKTVKELAVKFYFWIDAHGTYELPLIQLKNRIQTLFSITSNINASVKLEFDNHSINVRQFDSKPFFKEGSYYLKSPIQEVNGIRLDVPFNNEPSTIKSFKVESTGLINIDVEDPGLWFIYPKIDSADFFCPVVFKQSDLHENDKDYKYLFEASTVPDFGDRQSTISIILDSLARDPQNLQWRELGELYKVTKHLPLSTLDVWKAAEKSNRTLCTLFFLMPEDFITQLSAEFSILWRAIGVQDWCDSFDLYCDYIKSFSLSDPALTCNIIDNKLEQLRSVLGLGAIKSLLDQTIQPLNVDIFAMVLNSHLNGSQGRPGLRARHIDEYWPDSLFKEIQSWYSQIPLAERKLFPSVSGHQKAVVYLPLVLAYASVNPEFIMAEIKDIQVRFHVEQIKEFDADWFETIFDLTQGLLIINKK
jgi:hypothetical protein